MLNQVVLVGRITKEIEINESGNGVLELAVNRSFKNEEGIYETDFIEIVLFSGNLVDNVKEYCRKGDIVGTKGRLQVENDKLVVVSDKITFLSSRK